MGNRSGDGVGLPPPSGSPDVNVTTNDKFDGKNGGDGNGQPGAAGAAGQAGASSKEFGSCSDDICN